MIDHYKKLYDYSFWANKIILEAMKKSAPTEKEHLDLFAHILMAQGIWLERIKGGEPDFEKYKNLSLSDCERILEADRINWREFIESVDEENLNLVINYRTTEGKEFSNVLKEILTHVANHGTYHRGQIALTLKNKVPGISTDYIYYLRAK